MGRGAARTLPMRRLLIPALLGLAALAAPVVPGAAAGGPTPEDLAVPRYAHVAVIMDENKDWRRIDGGADAPYLTHLARTYGDATRFYAEVHPSEANYVALVGGSTFGIHDDDAYYCLPADARPACHGAALAGYAPHTVEAPSLANQLDAAHLSWKEYAQSRPADGSLAVTGRNDAEDGAAGPPVYASKHSGFMNFAYVQREAERTQHLVTFGAFERDLAANALPAFALIVPNLCDDMHGMSDPGRPEDCAYTPVGPLIARGDRAVRAIVEKIMATPSWRSRENDAIVITFDEDDGKGREGCCGVTPDAPSNFGGGHIATIVVTNHGPRGVVDPTPYNHYSLLRTVEDALGIREYLGLAAASDQGVRPMLPLFRTGGA